MEPAAADAKLKQEAKRVRAEMRRLKQANSYAAANEDVESDDVVHDWRDALLSKLKTMDPTAFERLAMRLLREAGFRNVEVLGRPGDGGIDGVGVYKVSLVSFPTYFQCKRYSGSVAAGAIRDFRGAMTGRGEKGLVITTGVFTPASKSEATRDGAPPIDLIDGEELCDLLKQFGIGVTVKERIEEDVTVELNFFDGV